MSFDHHQQNKTEIVTTAPQISNVQEFDSPIPLNKMLENKELLTCYRCKETFEKEDIEHQFDSNNLLLGIILNQRTPSSICLKCLSQKMMDVITEQFTKNSKDYEGLFFSYDHKFKV